MFSFRSSRARFALPAPALLFAAALWLGPADSYAQPLTLSEALQLAETDQPILRSQEAGVRAAEEAKVAAGQLPDPKLKLGLVNVPVTGPDAFSLRSDSMTMGTVGVMQEFPRAEKRRLRGQIVQIEGQQRERELAFSRRAIRRDVALSWLDVYYAQRAAQLAQALERESMRQVDTLGAGVRTGKASQADVLAARVDAELIRDRFDQLKRQESVARAELSRWIGLQADRPLPDDAPQLPEPVPTDELIAHIREHPHFAAQERQVEMAETQAQLARLGAKPDWNVEVSYGVRAAPNSDMVTVQFGIDLPLFQKNRQVRDVAAKLALAERARAQRDDNLREMQSMLRKYDAERRSARERVERYRTSILPQARQRIDLTLASYRSGRGDLAKVLEARRMELDLRVQQLMLEAEAARAQAQIAFYDPRQ